MASLNVPEKELPSLAKIAEMPQETFASLISVLGEIKPTLNPKYFSEALSKRVPTLDSGSVSPILNTLFSLYWMKERGKFSPEEMAQQISKAASSSKSKKFQFPTDKSGMLCDRLKLLLGFDKSLGVTAKAFDVMTEHDHVFCRARILSDIRPVFTSAAESTPAAVIIHNLQIGFHRHGKHDEFYVALDANDVEELKQALIRAEKKTITLRSILSKSNLDYLGP